MKLVTMVSFFLLYVNVAIWSEGNSDQIRDYPPLFPSAISAHETPTDWKNTRGQRAKPGYLAISCLLGKPCGDKNQCCCLKNKAWCVSQGLVKIPLLPTAITWLDFRNNSMISISNDTLQNVTSLVQLNLQANEIAFVHPEAFVDIKQLRSLELGDNNLNDFTHLISALGHAHQLEYVNASFNQFPNINLSALLVVPKLKTLFLSGNTITKIVKGGLIEHSRLQRLHLRANLLASFPDFCRNETLNTSFLPHLEALDIEWNVITMIPPETARCLPNLKVLKMGGNAIHHIHRNFLQGFPRLENLTLGLCASKTIDQYAFNHPHLKVLDISENWWFFHSRYSGNISDRLFHHTPRLYFINMSWTMFHDFKDFERRAVLISLKHIKAFDLSGTALDSIPEVVLSEFTNLTYLRFSNNFLTFLPDDTFENLTSLTNLDLSRNKLTGVSQPLLDNFLDRPDARLDLSNNPFACTCDLLWFIERYKEDYYRKEGGHIFYGGDYKCRSPDSQRDVGLAHMDITRQSCTLNRDLSVCILVFVIFTLVFLVITATVYKYRWQLRFMLYALQHRLSRESRATRPAPRAVYDIFVSYDSEDSQWVLNTLMPELEGRRGLRLCVHERDFIPGMFITHNIIEKMEESGTIVPLLSNAFLASDWCRFELFMALKLAVKRGPCTVHGAAASRGVKVLPILLEGLQREGVDSMLCALLKTTTYLPWPRKGSSEERERFWDSLCSVLQKQR